MRRRSHAVAGVGLGDTFLRSDRLPDPPQAVPASTSPRADAAVRQAAVTA